MPFQRVDYMTMNQKRVMAVLHSHLFLDLKRKTEVVRFWVVPVNNPMVTLLQLKPTTFPPLPHYFGFGIIILQNLLALHPYHANFERGPVP